MSPSSSSLLLLLPPILLSSFACVRRNCADRGTVIFVCRSCSSWLCNSLISVRSKDWSSWTSTYSPAAISLGTYVCSSCRTWLHACAAGGRRDGAHRFWCEVKEVICESGYLCPCLSVSPCRYEGSRDDLAVYAALKHLPVPAEFVNISRWHSHIAALIGPRSVIFSCFCLIFVLLFLVSLSGVFQADRLFRTRFGSSRQQLRLLSLNRRMWSCQCNHQLLRCSCWSSYWEWSSCFCSTHQQPGLGTCCRPWDNIRCCHSWGNTSPRGVSQRCYHWSLQSHVIMMFRSPLFFCISAHKLFF